MTLPLLLIGMNVARSKHVPSFSIKSARTWELSLKRHMEFERLADELQSELEV